MRILNVTQSYAPFFEFGGPPVKVRALSEGLAKLGHEVTVLTADWGLQKRAGQFAEEWPTEASPFGHRSKVNGVTAIYLANWFHYRAVSWNPALGRYLRARLGNFDVAHIFGLYDFFGPRTAKECRTRGIPYVVEPIGMFVPIVRSVRMKRLYHRVWGHEMLEGASAVVATGEQERDEIVEGGIPASKVVVRRNGVEGPRTVPERGGFRAAMKIPVEAKLVLFLGRLSSKKSPELLLEAFADLREDLAHLAFVGPDEGGMLTKLRSMAEKLGISGRMHFSPALTGDAKWRAYRDADVFVLPSLNENFGNTAAEAVAVGTPVIVTDQCGVAPLLRDKAGLVVRHDRGELAAALRELLGNGELYGRLQAGCRSAFEALGWEQPTLEMEMLYKKLARPGRS
jgi:glycosyltransferase involved in cell wall biosynthesis